jgi:hypothetical protein
VSRDDIVQAASGGPDFTPKDWTPAPDAGLRAAERSPREREAVRSAIERIVENELTGLPSWRIDLTNRLTIAALTAAPAPDAGLDVALEGIVTIKHPGIRIVDGKPCVCVWHEKARAALSRLVAATDAGLTNASLADLEAAIHAVLEGRGGCHHERDHEGILSSDCEGIVNGWLASRQAEKETA